jgi:hypothetical protein
MVRTATRLLSWYVLSTNSVGNPFADTGLQLDAIKQTKVDMQVYLGNYPIATDNGAAYKRQRDLILDALKTYGADHVAGITVGNEFILKCVHSLFSHVRPCTNSEIFSYVTDNGNGNSDPNSDVGNAGANSLGS